ncbi:MAG: NifU family protein [Ktedonobacterales bacterium]
MSSQEVEQTSRAERIETLLQEIAALHDPRVRAQMEELIQSLLDLFGDGLARMLELTEQSPAGGELLSAFTGDELIGSLLLLYGLHPDDMETRVAHAVDGVRGYVEKHGGNVTLVGITNGVAHVRLSGSCTGCSSSTSTLQPVVEEALYAAAPELEGVRVEDPAAAPSPLITLSRRPTKHAVEC